MYTKSKNRDDNSTDTVGDRIKERALIGSNTSKAGFLCRVTVTGTRVTKGHSSSATFLRTGMSVTRADFPACLAGTARASMVMQLTICTGYRDLNRKVAWPKNVTLLKFCGRG